MNEYLDKACNEFNLSRQRVISLKWAMNVSYKEYYEIMKDRYKTLEECQELCLDIQGYEIKHLFNNANSPYTFLTSLYAVKETIPNKLLIDKCKKVIAFVKSKEYIKEFGNDK